MTSTWHTVEVTGGLLDWACTTAGVQGVPPPVDLPEVSFRR